MALLSSTITHPLQDALVSGATKIATEINADIPPVRIQFLLDGLNMGPPVAGPPYTWTWNTVNSSNDRHTIGCRAIWVDGSTAEADVRVRVYNAALVDGWPKITDQELSKLGKGILEISFPERARQGETFRVQVSVTNSHVAGPLTDSFRRSGLPIVRPVEVGPTMQVSLETGDTNMQIYPLNAAELIIGHARPTIWTWDVRALKWGKHTLRLEASLPISIAHITDARAYPIYQTDLILNIDFAAGFSVKTLIREFWPQITTAVVCITGVWGYFVKLRKRKKRRAPKRKTVRKNFSTDDH